MPAAAKSPYSRQALILLVCGSLVVTLAMGIRHTQGLLMPPMIQDLGWGREAFAFAIALQNLVWGAASPFSGLLADRYGAGRVVFGCALLYVVGLIGMTLSPLPLTFALTAGVLVGLAQSGTTYSVIYGAVGRAVPPERRAGALALVAAAGSFGQFMMVPIAQQSIDGMGWLATLGALAALSVLMVPLARGTVEAPRAGGAAGAGQSVGAALKEAFGQRSFWLLTAGYFVCGFQVVFIGAHLPAYVIDKGLPANTGMLALALIGLFNILGTWGFGTLAARFPRRYLLAVLYFSRSVIIALFLLAPLSPWSVGLFAAGMGLLWLGTVPLTNGVLAQVFGVQYLAMLSGFVFFSHQVGSFLGAWLGGKLFDATGSYDLVWGICIALGVLAALVNLPVDERPLARVAQAAA